MTEQRPNVETGPPSVAPEPPVGVAPPRSEPSTTETAKDRAQDAAATVQDKAQPAIEKVQEAAAPVKERAQNVAGEAKAQAQAAAEQAKGRAAAQVDERTTQLGQQIGSQAEALEGVAGELRRQGKETQARVAEQAGQRLKDVGSYLEETDGEKLAEAAKDVVREHSAAAAAVSAAAGFAAGRVIKASTPDDSPEDETADPRATGGSA